MLHSHIINMHPSQFLLFSSKGRVARASSICSVGSEPSPALSVLSLDALVAPDTPIQFDIISPVSEENPGQNKTTAQSGRCVCVCQNKHYNNNNDNKHCTSKKGHYCGHIWLSLLEMSVYGFGWGLDI